MATSSELAQQKRDADRINQLKKEAFRKEAEFAQKKIEAEKKEAEAARRQKAAAQSEISKAA